MMTGKAPINASEEVKPTPLERGALADNTGPTLARSALGGFPNHRIDAGASGIGGLTLGYFFRFGGRLRLFGRVGTGSGCFCCI